MNDQEIDGAIRDALRARANSVQLSDLHPAQPPQSAEIVLAHRPSPRRWIAPLAAAAAVLIVGGGTAAVVQLAGKSTHQPRPPATQVTVPGPSSTPAPQSPAVTPTPTREPSATQTPSQTGSQPVPPAFQLGYQPLWPFASYADAEEWRAEHRAHGSQPWHLDAGQTALDFTRGFLGLTEINIVMTTATDQLGVHVGVGYRDGNGGEHTAAVLHLVRFGTEPDSGYEVVGSDDTTFSLELPTYGSQVSSPMTVGGHITGVDENIRVSVHRLGSTGPVGQFCCQPAGGSNQQWQAQVSFTGSGVMTVLATTGGHLQQVERFAIQGVVG